MSVMRTNRADNVVAVFVTIITEADHSWQMEKTKTECDTYKTAVRARV